MSHKNHEDRILTNSAEIVEDEKVEAVENVIGVVVNCMKLNIRTKPAPEAEIVAVVSALDELSIDTEASTDDWYAVCTVAGIEGFCMKKFVAVR